ncbi:MAG: TIGR04219 family outer membrane beta-barrel protein [Campylobacterota bacterium]|nr:TIGR04219 family outer membrane beta-barrel protein [Campylobacterota bacterium]
MKKILTTLVTLVALSSTASADLLRIEAGAGMWAHKAEGFMDYRDKDASAQDISQEVDFETAYAWAYFKHFLPLIPNLRVEYSKIESEGRLTATGAIVGLNAEVENLPTTLEMTQFEVIPYYNLLDNTFWITVDVGLAIKIIQYKATGSGEAAVGLDGLPITYNTNIEAYDETGTIPLPLLYSRVRGQIPLTEIGVEGTFKYISDGGDNSVSDMSVKLDYTLDFLPIIQPGLEVGYRIMSMDSDIEDGDTRTIIGYDFAGVFAGLMLRF